MEGRSKGVFAVILLTIGVACGDDAGSGAGGGTTVPSSTSTSTSSSSASSASGSTGGGGEDGGPAPCTLAEAEDRTSEASVTIVSQGVNYMPRCVRVTAGTSVTFESDFDMHPLRGGEVVDGRGVVDPDSPITPQDSGTSVTFLLDEATAVPYFCSFHASIGMFGTVFVEPP
jgi:plastocyanin